MSTLEACRGEPAPAVGSAAARTGIDWFGWPAALVLGLLSAVLRLRGIGDFSLTLDETTLVEFARGVLARGYPFVMVGTMEVPLATYELVPYPIAASMLMFGFSEFSVRLPAALFSVGTTVLVHAAASRWFDRRVAALAALLYAVSPWAIYWGQNVFHPAQAQFFALLTLLHAHPLLHDERPPARAYYRAALCFALAFLSWEGMGFLLPVIFITGLLVNGGRWQWLTRIHLWTAIAGIAAVVILQGVRRVLLQVSYLMVGSGKSEVSLPQAAFAKAGYDPWFYLVNFFGVESHVVLTAVFALGLFFLRRNASLRFVYALVLGAIFFLTNFLPFTSAHYVFWVLPLFLIGVSATTFAVADLPGFGRLQPLRTARAAGATIFVVLVALELATASPFGLKPYDVDAWRNPQRKDLRRGLAGVDYRGPLDVFKREVRPGDVVITLAALPMKLYAGTTGDYFMQSLTWQKLVYDPGAASPRYVDHYVGNPVLRSRSELEDLLVRHERVWLLVAPYGLFRKMQDRELINFIDTHLALVAESYDSELYLWQR